MYRFFVEPESICNSEIIITGSDVNHIKNVIRLKQGDEIAVSDGGDKEYICELTAFTKDSIVAVIRDIQGSSRELPCEIYLFQGYPKGDKMEQIIQKTVELGVSKIIPVMTKRSVVRLDAAKAKKKQERFQAIALAAAKQSKRGQIPEVLPVMSFAEALALAKTLDRNIVPYENAEGIAAAKKLIAGLSGTKTLGIFIGPEGGFDTEEIEALIAAGGETMTLGHRILRTETAGMAVMTLVMFELESDD